MQLLIVRHGKANPDSRSGLDADRTLRPLGERQAAWLAEHARTLLTVGTASGAPILLTSDARRAADTAAPIARALGAATQVEPRLRVDEPLAPVVDLLHGLVNTKARPCCAVLIGHNPQLALLIATLADGPTAKPKPLRTGEAVLLDLPPGDTVIGAARELRRIRLQEPG